MLLPTATKKLYSFSLFFPAHNEEKNILSTIAKALSVARRLSNRYEVIVVNDGSTDNTGLIAEKAAEYDSRIRVINHVANLGYGAAVLSGLKAAKHDYVFFSDADLQFDLEEIFILVKHIPEYQAVIGYRKQRMDPFMRKVNALGWNWLNRIFFGLKVKDIDCAFKLFKTSIVKNLPVVSRGAMLSAELLSLLQYQGIEFKEVAVTHRPRVQGSATGAKLSVIFRAFKEIIKVYNHWYGQGRWRLRDLSRRQIPNV